MAYTDIDDPTIYFETLLWTGNGNTPRTFTGLDFAPNMTWSKRRDDAAGHNLLDTVRGSGADAELCPSTNGAEGSNNANAYGYLSAYTSDGFTVTEGSSDNAYWNNNTATYVAWNWKAGTSFSNDASATSVGTIDSTGSINTTAGISIISYTGTGSAGTIAHGLGAVPKVVLAKRRSDASNWCMYHASVGNTKALYLNNNTVGATSTTFWNDTNPSSTVFTVGSDAATNGSSDTQIAYCFAEKKGYSKFGSYTGNGHASDGPYIYLGFRPAIVITKKTDGADDWRIFDNKRSSSGFNPVDKHIYPYSNGAESSSSTNSVPDGFDFLSNGFKIRQASAGINANGGAYIYMAFAESPFVTSTGIPNNAR